MNINNVILRPIISEQSMKEAENGKFTFAVFKRADKEHIKKAVELQFDVQVVGVATSLVKGKTKRVGTRREEVASTAWKKAIVTLKKGQKIALFDVGS